MGIHELLNFIESNDSKGRAGAKKAKKKVNTNKQNQINKTNFISSDCLSDNINVDIVDIINNEINFNEIDYDFGLEDDNELEEFKSKLIGDSIEAGVVKKIKPTFTGSWN